MNFTKEEISKGAQDARLKLTKEEEEELQRQMAAFSLEEDYFLEMKAKDIKPTFYNSPKENILGEDEVEPSLPLDKVLGNAPDDDESCFLVPRIIE